MEKFERVAKVLSRQDDIHQLIDIKTSAKLTRQVRKLKLHRTIAETANLIEYFQENLTPQQGMHRVTSCGHRSYSDISYWPDVKYQLRDAQNRLFSGRNKG